MSTDLGIKVDQLEIDQAEYAVTFCPLLKDPASYNPDTTDLAQDKEARWDFHVIDIKLRVYKQMVKYFCLQRLLVTMFWRICG